MLNFDDFEVLTFDCYGTLIDWVITAQQVKSYKPSCPSAVCSKG